MNARRCGLSGCYRVAVALWLIALTACHTSNNDRGASDDVKAPVGDAKDQRVVTLSESQRGLAGIATEVLEPRSLPTVVRAPGEVILNAYATSQVAPRIEAQIVARLAKLGDHVDAGQMLVTLSSVAMADAQGNLILTEREWRRVQELGPKVVSERRFVEAQVAAQRARATARAYGLTSAQIGDLLETGHSKFADGRFTLLAPQQGTVIRDDFVVGEMIQPGRVLFEITDDSSRWVEARLSPQEASGIAVGDTARVRVSAQWLDARVVQLYQTVDESTRTQPVRIELPDPARRVKPGVFVDVEIVANTGPPALALPDEAVLPTPNGDWEVFVETMPGAYRPVEVSVLGSANGFTRIAGVDAGTTIVTTGAFFLQSELGKSGFDADND